MNSRYGKMYIYPWFRATRLFMRFQFSTEDLFRFVDRKNPLTTRSFSPDTYCYQQRQIQKGKKLSFQHFMNLNKFEIIKLGTNKKIFNCRIFVTLRIMGYFY